MLANQADVKAFLRRVSRPGALESASGRDFSLLDGVLPSRAASEPALASAAEKALSDQPLTHQEQFVLEAIIIPGERPAVDIISGDYKVTHSAWLHFNEAPIKQRVVRAIASSGRVELPGHPTLPYGGTAWVAGVDLLMTNRHVAELFAAGLGLRQLRFRTGRSAKLDLQAERGGGTPHLLGVRKVVMIHPYWDMALLQVEGLPASAIPLSLSVRAPEELRGQDVAVIGYPAFDPRNDFEVQNTVFGGVYNVKRLQPGRAGARERIESFGKTVSALTHDSSTLGGNSGSLVLSAQSGEIVALHFAGQYLKANYGVPTAELARDGRIVDAGVSFVDRNRREPTEWDRYWAAVEEVGALVGDDAGDDRNSWTIPLEIRVRVGAGREPSVQIQSPPSPVDLATEAMVEPIHDSDLSSRRGYDPNFLGIAVPLPTPSNVSLCAPVQGGGHLLHYHHFSLAMHRRRRLALFTASNIDTAPAVRQPEPGRDYSRKGLTGLGPKDQEKWFTDPRVQSEHQLPDVFYNKDRQAFDKGHLVRREDVAWGGSYAAVRFANGDTYHTTNCSPQVSVFNRSTLGEDNWGDLENEILKQAKTEKLSLFAGPVLAQNDRSFMGFDSDGAVAVQIPRAFWKIVIARSQQGLQTFAFVLRQDLSDVDFEFAVTAGWKRFMLPIAELEAKLQVRFPQAVHDADQAHQASGAALRASSGVELVSPLPAPAVPPQPAAVPPAATPTQTTGTLTSIAAHAHDSVRGVLQGGRGLHHYLAGIDKLTAEERGSIVDQAILLLDGYYSHLQLKKAMYGMDPVQRLRLLRHRLGRYESEISFHNELTDIFTGLRDLHTNYLLPSYFAKAAAFLPFRVKYCADNRSYIVTETMTGLADPNFKPGVRLNFWNAVPIDRAVEIAANYHAGSNPAARHARGVDGLTQRALLISAPPDDEWVVVGYTDLAGVDREFRVEWSVVDLPEPENEVAQSAGAALALGLDLEGDVRRRLNALLFSPQKLAERRRIRRASESTGYATARGDSPEEAVAIATAAAVQGLQSTMPDVFDVRTFDHGSRKVGYLRIRTFSVPRDEPFVNEVIRLLQHPDFPKDRMILDVRGNGGGLIWAGERLLQLFTAKRIEPTRAQFAVTPLTVELSKADPMLAPWMPSLVRAVETGAAFSASFPITPQERCNDIGRRYPGSVVLVTDARCYSTTDMFAAGFKDHGIGKILGTDDNTGAGGANVWTIDLLRQILHGAGALRPLPRGGNMRVAIRRTLRVGPQAGTEIEDLGVEPDVTHATTLNDLLNNDADLLKKAAEMLP
jgi:DNA/RNA endonuclease G (NUC1)